jgi:hypothetical protein
LIHSSAWWFRASAGAIAMPFEPSGSRSGSPSPCSGTSRAALSP